MCHLKSNLIFLSYFYFLAILSQGILKWPSQYPRCHRDDLQLNNCILEATRSMKQFLKEGIPDLHIPKISPFYVPEVRIEQGGDSISYNLLLKNLIITGFDSYDFEKFDFDPKTLHFDAKLKMGVLDFKCDYEVKGKILSIPIVGSGMFGFKVLSSEGTLRQDGKLVKEKGVTYLDLGTPVIAILIGETVDDKYTGLFEGNEVLAKAADRVFRDNKNEVIQEVKPAVEKIIAEVVFDIQKKVAGRFSYDELYPAHK